MEEAFIFDHQRYFRFPHAELEAEYISFLCRDDDEREICENGDSNVARESHEGRRESSDAEAKGRPNGRQRRSSGRRRRRTEGEDGPMINIDLDILRMDLNCHCKFYAANLEERYLMFLSNTLPTDHLNGQSMKTSNSKSTRNGGQRIRERSSRSSEKQRRSAPIEETREGLDTSENEAEHKNGGARPRTRGKQRASYQMTPYQGPRRCCGEFHCGRCYRLWTSANSRANVAQPCNGCGLFVYPHSQWPLQWGMHSFGWPEGKEPISPDELADQENRPVGGKPPAPINGDVATEKIGERRNGAHRHRRPLRTQHRRRREQEV